MSNTKADADEQLVTADRSTAELAYGLLSTNNLNEATQLLEALLAHGGTEIDPVGKRNCKRIRVENGRDLFLKPPRDPDRNNHAGVDIFCELTSHRLVEKFEAPVGTLTLANPDEFGPSLIQPYYAGGDVRKRAEDPTDAENRDKLALLYALELWVLNADIKKRHFLFTKTDAGLEVRLIDHGHTLHRYMHAKDKLDDPSAIDDPLFNPTNQQAGDKPHFFGVSTVEDAETGFSLITEVTDQQIEEIVDGALEQLRALETNHPDIEEFLKNDAYHREAAVRLIQKRRDGIFELAENRLDTTGES